MKTYILGLVVLCTIFTLNACKKSEEILTPSDTVDTYSVPQGNNAFDQTIVNYYQKYGTYMLYNFTEKDAYWTPTAWTKPTQPAANALWTAGADIETADPAYIPAQLALIQSKWFSFYTDKFLKKFLPVKILLCKKVDSVYNGYVFTPTFMAVKMTKKVGAYYNYDNIKVNYGDATVNNMTAAEQRTFLTSVNITFIQSIIARGLSTPTAEFINSADYVTAMTTNAQSFSRGIIMGYYGANAQADWNAYITAMVTFSTVNMNTSTPNYDLTGAGILNVTKDTNGQIRKRYNIVRDYFINEYGVDLQLIGNATKGI
ncbi:hypothetical protein LPB86_13210 [Pedobacter sp. MC2016-14]|uniref:hypothetical protein n=1 Tax=Pedobacter sp. MC2016-14 TaxID=2897327 RepID=UPI001E2913E3|nr:hypothetical protein [Pedobacter sp. MC2016-14]MCD0489193.1 hypothetical protein [Pedobacter sp. MC2016-14]